MQEIEVKLTLDNPEEVRAQLKSTAEYLGEKIQRDVYFVMPDTNFFEEEPVHRYFRLRVQEGNSKLELHLLHLDTNSQLLWTEELEVPISEPEMLITMFEQLGIKKYIEVHKRRERYTKDEVSIVIDEVEGLGTFIEAELVLDEPIPDDQIEQVKIGLYEKLNSVGAVVEAAQEIQLGYPDLLAQKKLQKQK